MAHVARAATVEFIMNTKANFQWKIKYYMRALLCTKGNLELGRTARVGRYVRVIISVRIQYFFSRMVPVCSESSTIVYSYKNYF